MAYVKNVRRDNAQYGIKAVALDEALDATLLHKSELVNGFTQTTPGVNALDAAAGKSLNDSLANTASDLASFETTVANDYETKADVANTYPVSYENHAGGSTYVSVPSGTETELYSQTLSPGVYVLMGRLTVRGSTENSHVKVTIYGENDLVADNDIPGMSDWVALTTCGIVRTTSAKKYQFLVTQSSGATRNVAWAFRVLKLKAL